MILSYQVISPPRLENGDRLTRVEFEHRYQGMRDIKKAELIEGIVYLTSSSKLNSYQETYAYLMTWLGVYQAGTQGLSLAGHAMVRLDDHNEVQPDLVLRRHSEGTSWISEENYIEGAPELIVEILTCKPSVNLNQKLKVYGRNRVQEYLVLTAYERKLDWFWLRDHEYIPLEINPEGVLCSSIFPGLWLYPQALLAGDLGKVLDVLQQGLVATH